MSPRTLFFIFFTCSFNLFAQNDQDSIKAIINKLFTGMQKNDSALVRSCFINKPHLSTCFVKQGIAKYHVEDFSEFLKMIASEKNNPKKEEFREILESYDIKTDLPMAAAWTPYKFFIGEKFSHCGVNNFQLFKSPEGWKITGIMDTRRREPCQY